MTDQEKILALQAALKVAMQHWAAWVDESRGCHPIDVMGDDEKDWMRCLSLSLAWTNQALGGIGG